MKNSKFRNMLKHLSVLLILLALFLDGAARSRQVEAVTIGEIFGWLTDEEWDEDQDADQGTGNSEAGSGTAEYGTAEYYETLSLEEGGTYNTKDEVCAYLVQFHTLPDNYMSKSKARKQGWEGGALNRVIPGMCIGGSVYENFEEKLPVLRGRTYYECDIDTLEGTGGRGAKRIVFTSGGNSYGENADGDDWNIYYTEDHYKTFEHLYGEDDYE